MGAQSETSIKAEIGRVLTRGFGEPGQLEKAETVAEPHVSYRVPVVNQDDLPLFDV